MISIRKVLSITLKYAIQIYIFIMVLCNTQYHNLKYIFN